MLVIRPLDRLRVAQAADVQKFVDFRTIYKQRDLEDCPVLESWPLCTLVIIFVQLATSVFM